MGAEQAKPLTDPNAAAKKVTVDLGGDLRLTIVDGNATEWPVEMQVVPAFTSKQSRSALKCVVLPSTVKELSNFAFRGCGHLASVQLPSSLRILGRASFYGCASLESDSES